MQRVAPVNILIARSSRRAYAAAAEAAEGTRSSTAGASGVVAPGLMKLAKAAAAAGSGAGSPGGKPEIYWMKDPKTGNWIPENRFGEVDVVELRELLLSHNRMRDRERRV